MNVVTLTRFSICVPVPVIRGLTRFLTIAEVAEVEGGVVIVDCVAIFSDEGEGGELVPPPPPPLPGRLTLSQEE